MPRTYVKVTRERLKKAMLLRYEGKSASAIAEIIGVHENTIYKWFTELRSRGVDVPRSQSDKTAAATVFDDIARKAKGEDDGEKTEA